MKTLPLACLLAAIAVSLPAAAADPADTRADTALQELFKIDQNLMTLITLQQHTANQAPVCFLDGRQFSEGAVQDGRICQSGAGRLAWVPYEVSPK